MSQPNSFLVNDVRCFHGDQWATLKPITLLVGENSTGKSTFLGCYSVLHRLLSRSLVSGDLVDFNREPFSMGSFRDIVRSRRGRDGRIDEFSLGFKLAPARSSRNQAFSLRVTFTEDGSQPVVTSLHYQFDSESFLSMRRSSSGSTTLNVPGHEAAIDVELEEWAFLMELLSQHDVGKFFGKSHGIRSIADYLRGILPSQERGSDRRDVAPYPV